jgi:hypothetical protein
VTEWFKVVDCKSIGYTSTGSNPVFSIIFYNLMNLRVIFLNARKSVLTKKQKDRRRMKRFWDSTLAREIFASINRLVFLFKRVLVRGFIIILIQSRNYSVTERDNFLAILRGHFSLSKFYCCYFNAYFSLSIIKRKIYHRRYLFYFLARRLLFAVGRSMWHLPQKPFQHRRYIAGVTSWLRIGNTIGPSQVYLTRLPVSSVKLPQLFENIKKLPFLYLWKKSTIFWTRRWFPIWAFQKYLKSPFPINRSLIPRPVRRATYALSSKEGFSRLANAAIMNRVKKRRRYMRTEKFKNFEHRRIYRNLNRDFLFHEKMVLRRAILNKKLQVAETAAYLQGLPHTLRGTIYGKHKKLERTIFRSIKSRVLLSRRRVLTFLAKHSFLSLTHQTTLCTGMLRSYYRSLQAKKNKIYAIFSRMVQLNKLGKRGQIVVLKRKQVPPLQVTFRKLFQKTKPFNLAFYWRFIRKYRTFIRVTTLRNNMFFLAQRGDLVVTMHTGLFEELRHGTKRKRTQLTGWYLFNKFSDEVKDIIKRKTTFFVDFYGKTAARSGAFKSLQHATQSQAWRIMRLRSLSPIVFNGTKARRKRRL